MDSNTIKYASNGLSLLFKQLNTDSSLELIDPFCTIFKLAILNYKPEGTKLSIKNNTVSLQENTALQGFYRWYNSDERDQLYQLKLPIFYFRGIVLNFIKFSCIQIDQYILDYINDVALKGLKKMKITYDNDRKNGSLVKNCIDSYIKILSTYYNFDEYEKEMLIISKPTVFAIYAEYVKIWTQYDFKILKKLFYLTDAEESTKLKNKLADTIDLFIDCKNMKIDSIRPD